MDRMHLYEGREGKFGKVFEKRWGHMCTIRREIDTQTIITDIS